MLDCGFKPVVAPSTVIVTCADAGIGLRDMHWTSWTPRLASGHGTFWENDCKPDCADGHFHYYPSLAVLWGSATVEGHPADRRYTELTVIFTGKMRPPVYVVKNGQLDATYPLTQTFEAIWSAGSPVAWPQPTRVFTALVRSARADLASAKYMLVFGSVYSSLSMPA
jgi:hypothetical protein